MKYTTFITTFILLVLCSCSNFKFKKEIIELNDTSVINSHTNMLLESSLSFEYLKEDSKIAKEINSSIVDIIDTETLTFDEQGLRNLAHRTADNFILEYQNDTLLKDMTYSIMKNGTFETESHNILPYLYEEYFYTGGAHGITTLSAYNISTLTGKILQEEDIFKQGFEVKIKELLKKHLSDVAVFEGTVLTFENLLAPENLVHNHNFYVSKKGITYIYNPYEITAYAFGIIKITIPWNELQDIIKLKN